MSRRRRIVYYSLLFLVAGGLLIWQWRTTPRVDGERLNTWLTRAKDPDPEVRIRAATALGELGRNSDEAWSALTQMALRDDDDIASFKAVDVLKGFCQTPDPGDDAKRPERKRRLIETMLAACKDPDANVRLRAPRAVYAVAGLEYHDQVVRRASDDAIDREMRPKAIAALVAALKDENAVVRSRAARCLKDVHALPAGVEVAKEPRW